MAGRVDPAPDTDGRPDRLRASRLTSIGLPLATAALLGFHIVVSLSIYWSVAVLALASGLHLVTIGRHPARWWMVGAVVVLAAVSVARHPVGTDLWSYQAYGRTLSEYRENPFETAPIDHLDDPVMLRVNPVYLDVPSAYGPVFVVVAAGVSKVSGTGELAGRLMWQGLAAAAVLATIVVLARRRVSAGALAAFALHPIVAYQLVHLAHNDVLVGLLILLGCLAGQQDRLSLAALAFAGAALVKAPSGMALVVFLAWLVSNRRTVEAVRALGVAAATAFVAMAPFGITTSLEPILGSRGQANATNIWNAVRGGWRTFTWTPIIETSATAGPVVSTLAIVVPVLIALGATYLLRDRPLYEPLTVGLLAWLVLSLYPSAWYYAWLLPLVALWAPRPRLLIAGQVALYQVATQSWLFPLAALIGGDGELGVIDRLPAPLLGITSLAGLALVAWLVFHPRRAEPVSGPDPTRLTEAAQPS